MNGNRKDFFMDQKNIARFLSMPPPREIGILGDFCVDVYWDIEPEKGEKSLETGLKTTPVSTARYGLGGAGNIVANLRALGVLHTPCFGAAGRDPFGLWLRRELMEPDPEPEKTLIDITRPSYHTPTYCKPLLHGVEQSRIDLGNVPLTDPEADWLLNKIDQLAGSVEVLIINQQIFHGIHTPRFRKRFAEYVKKNPKNIRFVYDGRDFLDAYPGVILKINASAASRLAFGTPDHSPEESGKAILAQNGVPLVITDGAKGAYVFEEAETTFIPAIPYEGPIDTVGAGDSFTAGFAYGLALGGTLVEAAELGTCCSAVTIRKLNQTGTPTPREILELF